MVKKMTQSKVILPLSGLKVISLEHAIAAPFCSRQLADLGAQVIKVERPRVGDFARSYDNRVKGLSSHFVWTNRSKESIEIDLKSSEGISILMTILRDADVLIQNLSPGAAKRLGLSYEDLRSDHPKLIVCDISGYGAGGPYEHKKAYDLLIQSEAGFLSVTGNPGIENMAKAGCSIADIAAGMYAYTSILSALLLRQKTGKGSHIDVSMLESLAEWMGYPLYYAYDGAAPPSRAGASHSTIYPYGPFSVGDGNTVMLGLQNEREWEAFCNRVLLKPELVSSPLYSSNQKRSENRQKLRDLINETFARLTLNEVTERLDKARIASGTVNEMAGVWAHPQLQARERWREIDSGKGTLTALLPPGSNSDYIPVMKAVPEVGEHSERILREHGYTAEEIESFRQKNVI